MLNTILGIEYTSVNKIEKILVLLALTFYLWKKPPTVNVIINCIVRHVLWETKS